MTLDPIAIATIGYVCNSVINPITRGTHGYICPAALPPEPPEDPFGGGHGAVIVEPQRRIAEASDDEQLALLAVLAIEEMQ